MKSGHESGSRELASRKKQDVASFSDTKNLIVGHRASIRLETRTGVHMAFLEPWPPGQVNVLPGTSTTNDVKTGVLVEL